MVKEIDIDIKLNDPNRGVKPKDEVLGVVSIINKGKKDKKLKKVKIKLIESYYKYGYDARSKVNQWLLRIRVLKKYAVGKDVTIRSGETTNCEFKIILPKWKPKIKKRFSDWHLLLGFIKETLGIYHTGSIKGVTLKLI